MVDLGCFIKERVRSFGYAFRGLGDILKTEHNARVHAVCTLIGLGISVWLNLDAIRFSMIMIAIALVWITEAFNTVLELVVDIVSPEYSKSAGRAKDISAAAVLVASVAALVIGVVCWGPAVLIKFGL